MFEVTEQASSMIKYILKKQDRPLAVRIVLQSGCCGASLGMALDETQENDSVFTDGGVTYVIEKDLLEKVKPIRIDFSESDAGAGFTLSSNLQKSGSCC